MKRNIVIKTEAVTSALEQYLRSLSIIDDNEFVSEIMEQANTFSIELKRDYAQKL